MKIKADNIYVCSDCLQIIVNGDYTNIDYYYNEAEGIERIKEIEIGIDELQTMYKGRLVNDYDCNSDQEDNGFIEFTSQPCDCCGTHLAGSRYRFSVIGNERKVLKLGNSMIEIPLNADICIDYEGNKVFPPLNKYKYNDNPNCR